MASKAALHCQQHMSPGVHSGTSVMLCFSVASRYAGRRVSLCGTCLEVIRHVCLVDPVFVSHFWWLRVSFLRRHLHLVSSWVPGLTIYFYSSSGWSPLSHAHPSLFSWNLAFPSESCLVLLLIEDRSVRNIGAITPQTEEMRGCVLFL